MRPRQGESGELDVIELCAHPVVHGVARFAGGWQTQSDVIDASGFRIDEIPLVTGVALRRKTLKLADRSALVTGVAVHARMSSDQRETVQMLVDLLNGNMPAFDGVALFAVSAHLPLVNVRVAVRTLGTHIGEDHLGVALGASHALMQSAQGVPGGVVVKLRHRPDGFPSAQGVTVLAGNAQASVRTSRIGRRLRLSTRRLTSGEHRQSDGQVKQNCRSQGLPNPFEQEVDSVDGNFSKVSKVVEKNSNPMSSKLIELRNVVEGYTSTCSEVKFRKRRLGEWLPFITLQRCKKM